MRDVQQYIPTNMHIVCTLLSFVILWLGSGQFYILHNTWCHQMETFSGLLAFYGGNSPVTGEFPAQRLVMQSFDVFFDLHLKKQLSKQSWGWWYGMPLLSLWCNRNDHGKFTTIYWDCFTSCQTKMCLMTSYAVVETCIHFIHWSCFSKKEPFCLQNTFKERMIYVIEPKSTSILCRLVQTL